MKNKDLTKLKHSLVNAPLHFYTEVADDGTEILRHIRVQQRCYQVPDDGDVTIDSIPADSVGTEQIKDGGVQMQDLSSEAREAMVNNFATDKEVKAVLGI